MTKSTESDESPGKLEKIAKWAGAIGAIVGAIGKVAEQIGPLVRWLAKEYPVFSRYINVYSAALLAVGLISMTAGAIMWWRRRQMTRNDPPKDAANSADSTSPSIPVMPPAFHSYTVDDFDGLKWRWRWRPGVDFIRPDFIEDLAAFCPKCGLRIVPVGRTSYESERFGGRNIGGRTSGGYAMGRPHWFCRLRCEEGCVDKEFPDHETEVFARIKNRIERNSLNASDN